MIFTAILANVTAILALAGSNVNASAVTQANSAKIAELSEKADISAEVVVEKAQKQAVSIDIVDNNDEGPDKVVQAVVTAYTSTPGQTDDSPFIAATGKRVHDGMIAVNGLPFGTIIKIPELFGDKEFVVEDRMNKRYSCAPNHCNMDIWMDTTVHEARVFGLHRVQAEIYLPELASK